MTVIKFPSKLPSASGLDLAQAQLVGLLQDIAGLALARANELIQTKNPSEFASVVRAVADDTAKASAGWAALSAQIRQSWGV